jgi:DNA mismatch repair protein MutH
VFDAPLTETELCWRAAALDGRTLGELARVLDVPVPPDLRRAKGWGGGLVEQALGATAGNRPIPDFHALGVELKTIPCASGRPRESTFVCGLPADGGEPAWEVSRVRHKLTRVLWVPVAAEGPPADRRIGPARLWSPSPDDEEVLQADWEELTGLVRLGELHAISARRGRALQLRPKAAGGDATTWALDDEGEWRRTLPLAFYLRATFTAEILARPPSLALS